MTLKEWRLALFAVGKIEFEDGRLLEFISDTSWDAWQAEGEPAKKAEVVVQGVDGGFWNSAMPLEMPPQATELNTGLVLPHIAWAKPHAGERLSILAIHSRWKQAHTIGLYHRLDADVKAIFSDAMKEDQRAPFWRAFKGATKLDILADVAEATEQSYDVIIMGGISEELFGADAQAWLKAQVAGGAALIIAGGLPGAGMMAEMTKTPVTEVPDFLAVGVPYEKLPGLTPGADKHLPTGVSLYEYGKGRVVKLGFHIFPYEARTVEDETSYEYYQSFLIKAILWAGGNEPAVAFKDFPVELAADKPGPGMPGLKFTLAGSGTYDVELGICTGNKLLDIPSKPYAAPGVHQGDKLVLPVREMRKTVELSDATPVEFDLPSLPAGEYFVSVRVSQDGVNVNWATPHLTVTSGISVKEVTTDPTWLDMKVEKVLPIKATIVLSDPAPAGASLDVSVIDNYDRLLDRKEIKLAEGQDSVEVALSVPHIVTVLGRVRAELQIDGDAVHIGIGRFTTVRRDWDKFIFSGWVGGTRLLAGLGQNGEKSFGGFNGLERFDVPADPGTGGARVGRIDTDPEVLAKRKEEVQDRVREAIPFDPLCYSSTDEVRYGGGEELPARVADFREQLQAEYGTIEALNEQWDSDYGSFDDIPAIWGPVTTPYLENARKTKNFSPLVDQHLENIRAYTNNWRFWADAIDEVDPGGRMGTEAPLWPWAGSCFDWYSLCQIMGFFSPYGRDGDLQTYEFGSSFSKPGTLLAMTYGGYLYNGFIRKAEPNDLEFNRWRPWSALFRGYNGISWYLLGTHGINFVESGVAPDGEPYPALLTAADTIAEIRTGYYTLFRGSEREHDGVAIHYSVPSNVVAEMVHDFISLPWDVHALIRILQDYAPRRYEFVATQQIEKGELDKYNVLFLPLSQAITKAESAEFEKFVRRGGLLIADVRPGIADKHGKVGNNKVMEKLFGVTYRKTLGRKLVTAELSGEYKGVPFKAESGRFPVDPALVLDGAEAAAEIDGVPLVTYNPVGKGAAICINSPFNWYKHPTPDSLYFYLAYKAQNVRMGSVLKAIFKAHGIKRTANVEPVEGEWPWGVEIRYHTDADAQYVGLTKRRGAKVEPDREMVVTVPREGHVYDMFSGKYYGRTDSWNVTMPASDVQLFSVMPYEVKGLKVTLKSEAVSAGSMIEGIVGVEKGSGPPVRHVINLQVTRPDGKTIRYLAENLETQGGAASFSIPLALNEPKGAYTLTFTDVASQKQATVGLNVR